MIGIIGLFDWLTGYEIGFSLFYAIPVSFVVWFTGQPLGLATSLASALVWLWADVASGHLYSHPLISLWNTLIRFSFFVIITLLLSAIRRAVDREAEFARTDALTGAVNSRFFYDFAQRETDRFQRYGRAFSLAYIDLDNFKAVNDQMGHTAGDQVLRRVVGFLQMHIRRTDVIARLGGDEFAMLLPETDTEMARLVCAKLQAGLLHAMRENRWPVTFSIGVLTCQAAPPNVDALVRLADELMYAVKHSSKNNIKIGIYTGQPRNEGTSTAASAGWPSRPDAYVIDL